MADRPLAMVLLHHPIPASGSEAIVARWRSLFPEDPEDMQLAAPGVGNAWPLLMVQGGELLTVMQMEAPMPGPELAARAAAAYWWPQAGAAVAAHRAHLVVAPIGSPASDAAGAVASARRVTRLAAALAAAAGPAAIGVLWAGSGTLWPVSGFVELARRPSPLSIWVDIRLLQGQRQGEVGVATRGLRPLVGRELRLEPTALLPPAELAQRCLDIASYLLSGGGAALRDGDTIGTSPEELLHIRAAEDPALGGPVYVLTAEKVPGGRQ